MTIKHIWLIRHGQTNYNAEHRWQGHLPTVLNPNGKHEAQQLAAHLQHEPITALYSSDLPRATQTAAPLAKMLKLALMTDARLREIKLGVFEGLDSEEIKAKMPGHHAAWKSDDDSYAPPDGESRLSVMQRAAEALDDIAKAEHSHIGIVTHGGTIRLLLRRLFPTDPTYQGKIHIPNTSLTRLQGNPQEGWQVVGLAQTPHLSDSSSSA